MRKAVVLTVVMILFLGYSRSLAQMPTEGELKMLLELRIIRSLLMEMKADIAKLKEEIKENQADNDDDDDLPVMGRFRTVKVNSAKLRKIKLSKNPTEEQVKEYINKIAIASRGQNSFSSEDPQVRMLTKIGAENLKFLIESLGSNIGTHGFGGKYHIKEAIYKLAGDEHKKLIMEFLPQHTSLVKIVLDRGWEKDAKEILIEELSSTSQNLPYEWIQAVANLNDPKTYKDLRWFLVNQNNRSSTFKAIKHLPGIKLEESVNEAWTEGTGQNDWERRGIAEIAVQYGHFDALEYLVDFLINDRNNRWAASAVRQHVLRHLKFYGSNKEILAWLKKNKDKIVFDKKTKKFMLDNDK
jgi:hypothetical protein